MASVATRVKPKLPVTSGIPDKRPFSRARPLGRVLPALSEKAYGAAPPDAVSNWLNDVPAVVEARMTGLITNAGQAAAKEYVRSPAQPPASVACNVKLKLPVAVGVPDSALPTRARPAGKVLPALSANAYGAVPPEAESDWLKAAPTVAGATKAAS